MGTHNKAITIEELVKQQKKKEAILFQDWASDNQFTKYNNIWKSTKIHYFNPVGYTTEKLYELYQLYCSDKLKSIV